MDLIVKQLGQQDYQTAWEAMQTFTRQRDEDTPDELWIVEHPPVYTQGLNGKAEHVLHPNPEIPIVQTDRGGQITYHGPGQLVIYILVDLKRRKLGVRALVSIIENAIIELLASFHIDAVARADAPGVYVNGQKIASLGLKIRKQKSYHGLALNVDMDLEPFQAINPCGLLGMQMAQLSDFIAAEQRPQISELGSHLCRILQQQLDAGAPSNAQ
ncbi:lipoyl(octanoyl) transferase LipB [Thiomicrorhabdus sp. 6S3-12]|uniref:lipoyl(octanoyl) transferase LipB n=1 Tax=Thiomicrorhabdus sp. 6S3-12 TaxID=2819681 RepID=UPI001AADC60E|nr:lipoyl(octanoyl) transferase LipB [Thiomicrorhabdus sp. 6S3-12]MBO1922893.1 lipoyl(octanoyl) transferase LipB [Thiomicrorhabdus sp. 6S3-12]